MAESRVPRDDTLSREMFRFLDEIDRAASPSFVTVGALPTAPRIGSRSFVTDANATTFASIVAAGGSNTVPVYFDGTNWRIG